MGSRQSQIAGRWMFPNVKGATFPGLFWKNPVPGILHTGMQTIRRLIPQYIGGRFKFQNKKLYLKFLRSQLYEVLGDSSKVL